MTTRYETTARAFDAVAADYDATYGPEGNAVMTWMRRENLALLLDAFPPDSRLLELGCGSGEEATALALAGRTVLATDVSPKMAAVTRAKALAAGVGERVQAAALPAGGLDALWPPTPFDGAYASFGSLNCEPDLAAVGTGLARLLRPGGLFIASVMGPACLFEIAWYLLHGHPGAALRRLRRGWQPAPVAGEAGVEVQVDTRYLTARDIVRACGPAFTVTRVLALPLFLPPPYADTLFRQRRAFFRHVEPWERRLRARWPWRHLGDHVVIALRRL